MLGRGHLVIPCHATVVRYGRGGLGGGGHGRPTAAGCGGVVGDGGM